MEGVTGGRRPGENRARVATAIVASGPIVATIAQRAFGPMLAARVTALLEPTRAVDIPGRLPTEVLADTAVELDPRRAGMMLVRLEPARIAATTRIIVERAEEVTTGGFVEPLGEDALRAAVAELDDATLVRVGFVLEDKDPFR